MFRNRSGHKALGAMLAALCAVVVGCGGGAGPSQSTSMAVRLNYLPWAMHNYLYAALDQGYFQAEQLDVEILPGQAGQSVQLVGAGREKIGVTDATAFLSAVEQGAPIVAIAMDWPFSPGAIFFEKSSGIRTAQDLVGKKVCTTTGSNTHASILAGLTHAGITSGIEWATVPTNSSDALVAAGRCDAAEGFAIGQPQTLEVNGHPTAAISVGDLGLKLYGNVIFTNRTTLETEKPALVRFLQAATKGQIWAYEHVTEATMNTLKRNKAEVPEADLLQIQEIYKQQYMSNPEFKDRWGTQSTAQWQETISTLMRMGTLKRAMNPSDIYTNEIVERAEATAQFATLLHTKKWAM